MNWLHQSRTDRCTILFIARDVLTDRDYPLGSETFLTEESRLPANSNAQVPPGSGNDASGSVIRVLVVDDFERFRQFVCSTLAQDPHLEIIGEAADGLEAVQKAEKLQPDLIVIDLGLPYLNGIEALRQIRILCPLTKIVFASQESSVDVVRLALSAGALGYVVKAQAASDLLVAVQAALRGEQFVSSVVIMDAGGQP